MANAIFSKYKQAMLDHTAAGLAAPIRLENDTIKAVLVDAASYTPDLAAHQFLSDIPIGARIATSGALSTKSTTLGVFDADDATFIAASGNQSEYCVVYKDTGVAGTSPLLAIYDTGTGLPITPSGGDVIATWDNGVAKIFRLA
jgi:hypothetical protein